MPAMQEQLPASCVSSISDLHGCSEWWLCKERSPAAIHGGHSDEVIGRGELSTGPIVFRNTRMHRRLKSVMLPLLYLHCSTDQSRWRSRKRLAPRELAHAFRQTHQ
jgi:hypothetical protein